MALALVTGSRPYLRPAATALARTGFNVVTWEPPASPPPPGGPFDCYLQLPCADGLVCRIDTLAAVAGRLGPDASVLLGVEDVQPGARSQRGATAPDLLEAMALALLEDLGRPAARVAVVSVGDLCRPAPAFTRIDPVLGATQWEMPTPPLVSAP
ncbi:MAG TPA: hypothetical protein VFW57_07475 [Acidimicrobiia bacterium]|nr:hypothetical protein [Acidimicrobiia bacterium]